MMRALVYTGTEASELRDVPEPEPAEDMTIVDVSLCGICGSDMHAWHGHDSRRVPPLVLGHEAVGVARTGPLAGKRVAVNPLMTCGVCPACLSGEVHLCPHRELIGMRLPGAFAEQVAIRHENLSAMPDALADADAVLAEPLACAVHAVRLGLDVASETPTRAVVLGGGAIGLLSAMVFREYGVTDIAIAETNPLRAETLRSVLDAEVYEPLTDTPPEAEMILDAVGMGATRRAASAQVTPGGTIVHIGLQDNADGLDTRRITLQEIRFVGTYCYRPDDFAEALRLLAEGRMTGSGWSETRDLAAGAQSFVDIHTGTAPPKIVLSMGR